MNILKLTFAAATLTVGLMASATAMPVGPIAPGATSPVEQVRLVCNSRGRCWHVGGYSNGYRSGYGYRRGHRDGYRSSYRGYRNGYRWN